MLLLFHQDEQITVDTSATGRISFSRHESCIPSSTPAGIGWHYLLVQNYAVAVTVYTSGDTPPPVTGGTGCGGLHLSQDGILYPGHHTATVTGGAGGN